MTEQEAINKLSEYFDHLRAGWQKAWQLMGNYSHPALQKQTRAAILQNHAVDFCKKSIQEAGLGKFTYSQNKSELPVNGIAVISFKKLTTDLLPRNNHTKRSKSFYNQASFLAECCNLVSGAVVSDDWSELTGIYLVQTKSYRHINWALNITTDVSRIDEEQSKFFYVDEETEGTGFFDVEDDDEEQEGGVNAG